MRFVLWLLCLAGPTASPQPVQVFAVGKPQQQARWVINPKIRVCGSTGISYSRISQAARYWERAGYTFESIRKDPFQACMTPAHGEIIVTIPEAGFANHHMASTRVYTNTTTGDIVRAKIQILPKNAHKERVIEHEIGHALGWIHYPQRYHIMHPTWHMGGYDRSGIRKQRD